MTTLAPATGLLEPTVAEAIRLGLSADPRRLPFECFYDDVGSALFEAITQLPEYGLSRAGKRLLARHRDELAHLLPVGLEVVELGSGSGRTTRLLLEALAGRGRVTYRPVDISRAALGDCERELGWVPGLHVSPIEGSHLRGLEEALGPRDDRRPALVLFLGSNIGNFARAEAEAFLRDVRSRLRPADTFLLAADLVKPASVLIRAYDDPAGVSAAFNRNALARINRELLADFDVAAFRHRAAYDGAERRVEMHLVCDAPQEVRVRALDLYFRLAPGEAIWTESSYKFRPGEIAALGEGAGFELLREWTDEHWPFSQSLFAVPSP
jgi:dimethylhistidine N-methyltransferase